MKRSPESGVVSVYFIAVTAAFVLLTALLIDFSRIAAFRNHAELAVQSGVRSILSSYDPILYARYGLFVRGGEDAGELLRTTAEGHFNEPNKSGAFPYIEAEWISVDATESRPLADHEIFRRQVLEEMKYKAPIDLTLEFADRFRGVSPAMKEAAATVDMLEQMRKAYDRREAALDEVVASQQKGGQKIVSLLRELAPYPPISISGSLPAADVNHAADAALQYDDYIAKRQDDETREKNRHHGAVISRYESGVVSLARSLATQAGLIRSSTDEAYLSSKQAWVRAKEANDEMRDITQRVTSLPSGGDTHLSSGTGAAGELDQSKVQSIAELRKTAEQLLLDDSFFTAFSDDLETQRIRGANVANEANHFSALASSVPGSSGIGSALRDGAGRLQKSLEDYAGEYGTEGSVIRDRRRLLESHRSRDEERKTQERMARSEWSGLTGFVGELSGRSGSAEERASFDKAARLAHDNLEWNRTDDIQADSTLPGDSADGRDRAMSGANGLMEALKGSLSGQRDQMYFSEYAIQRFSRFPPSEVKKMLEGAEVPLPLENQETEYVLYGLNNPARNIAAAYGEIISLRLAIRTMEGLIECRAMGHPLLVLAAALVYGIRNALLDMQRLVERDSVPLSKYIQADTSYSDYLRLFMLIHGGSAGHLARSIAVMEQATGVSLTEAYTYVSAEGTASLRLWFFPGLLKVMGRVGQLGGTVKGNRYEASYTADSSYQ
ncbi:MAG: hypothetical protein JWR03_505 [Cohnella sp.]|nr:hypothetical protein [Cohnella sp.]